MRPWSIVLPASVYISLAGSSGWPGPRAPYLVTLSPGLSLATSPSPSQPPLPVTSCVSCLLPWLPASAHCCSWHLSSVTASQSCVLNVVCSLTLVTLATAACSVCPVSKEPTYAFLKLLTLYFLITPCVSIPLGTQCAAVPAPEENK